jgi:hypothetical protein
MTHQRYRVVPGSNREVPKCFYDGPVAGKSRRRQTPGAQRYTAIATNYSLTLGGAALRHTCRKPWLAVARVRQHAWFGPCPNAVSHAQAQLEHQ